jgi:hypothetical protein
MIFFEGNFYNGMKRFGEDIGIIINTLILTIVYILGIGLTFIVSKLVGKKFLDLKIDKNKDTYWTTLNLNKKPFQEYLRQF